MNSILQRKEKPSAVRRRENVRHPPETEPMLRHLQSIQAESEIQCKTRGEKPVREIIYSNPSSKNPRGVSHAPR